MKIRWIGQSGYVVKTDTTEILIDPYLSDIVNKIANRPRMVEAPMKASDVKADAIICTHNHLDHLDVEAISEMDKTQMFVTTLEGKEKLYEMGFSNVEALNVNDTISVGDMELQAVYAKHTVEAFGLLVRTEDIVMYFSGDTLFDKQLFEISTYRPDITFICINGKLGNMNVDEAVIVAKEIGAKVNVPNHYGMFASNTENPEKFTKQMDNGFIMEFNREYHISELL